MNTAGYFEIHFYLYHMDSISLRQFESGFVYMTCSASLYQRRLFGGDQPR